MISKSRARILHLERTIPREWLCELSLSDDESGHACASLASSIGFRGRSDPSKLIVGYHGRRSQRLADRTAKRPQSRRSTRESSISCVRTPGSRSVGKSRGRLVWLVSFKSITYISIRACIVLLPRDKLYTRCALSDIGSASVESIQPTSPKQENFTPSSNQQSCTSLAAVDKAKSRNSIIPTRTDRSYWQGSASEALSIYFGRKRTTSSGYATSISCD